MREDLIPTTYDGKLGRIVEECGEVLKACGKIYRFGPTATDPATHITYDNVLDLHKELNDLKDAIHRFQID